MMKNWLNWLGVEKKQDKTQQTTLGEKLEPKQKANKTFSNEELRSLLISKDVGLKTTESFLATLHFSQGKVESSEVMDKLKAFTQDAQRFNPAFFEKNSLNSDSNQATIIANIGTNGSGKTTSIAKIAQLYRDQNQGSQSIQKVVLVGTDLFRSGAEAQLKKWADDFGFDFFQSPHKQANAIAYSAIETYKNQKCLILIDTAGRLGQQTPLMDELKKMKQTLAKTGEKIHWFITLDSTNGQQAIEQFKQFNQSIGVDGLMLSKADGSAKAGFLITIANESHLWPTWVGVGEKITDIVGFNPHQYLEKIVTHPYN